MSSRLPPAYRGAPYYQPRPPPGWRRQQLLRKILLAVIGVIGLFLIVIACASLANGAVP
jgi:hypothetical protein